MKTTRSFLLLLMLLATSGLNAQKEEDKYAALVSEVRNEVWSLNLPDFKNMTVPEKYRNEPAVILAAHSRLEVTRKTKLDWWGMGLTKQQITCRSIYRQMVYINSQSALEEMSQFSFLSQEKERYTRNEQQRILGVRIIKPDGTIQETAPQEYMETDEGGHPRSHNIQEKWNKLAVPGLEIGDIIDLFFVRYNSKTPYAWMPPSARKPGLYANPNPKLMTDDTRASMKAPGTNWSGLRSGRKGEISKALKARQAEGWSDKKLMDYLYQYCYYRYMENGADYTPASFILLMHELLEKAGIPHRTGITTKDTREPLDQLINYSNTTWFIYLESNGKCYTPPACYAVPGEVPASLQGEEAILEDNTCLTLPSTTPQDNRDMATINASISGTTLHISRREEMSGALKEHFQPYLIMDEDLYNSVRRQLGITATIYDETKEKFHADLRESYRREREQEKERYHNEIIGYHGSEEGLETLLGYQLFSIGNRADSAALVYQVDYVLDGYVKKAGTNFVLSVGRLIGSQPELKGEQRLRKEDIYWEMPRCYQWDITVNLPEGYRISPEGLERLNVKVENDCGAFIVQATTEDGTLRIKAEKRINHKTEPVANWEKLLEITDAANSYEALSIVFQATINPPTSPTTGY